MMRLQRPKWKDAGVTPIKRWRVLRGDRVQVMAGKNKGQRGVVKSVVRGRNQVIVEGVNLVKKHQAGSGDMEGGIARMRKGVTNVPSRKPPLYPVLKMPASALLAPWRSSSRGKKGVRSM